ncbi:hypothetical protein ACJQWK_01138 [Exserohilum turcicum]
MDTTASCRLHGTFASSRPASSCARGWMSFIWPFGVGNNSCVFYGASSTPRAATADHQRGRPISIPEHRTICCYCRRTLRLVNDALQSLIAQQLMPVNLCDYGVSNSGQAGDTSATNTPSSRSQFPVSMTNSRVTNEATLAPVHVHESYPQWSLVHLVVSKSLGGKKFASTPLASISARLPAAPTSIPPHAMYSLNSRESG